MPDEFVRHTPGGDETGSEGDVLKRTVMPTLDAVKEQPFG